MHLKYLQLPELEYQQICFSLMVEIIDWDVLCFLLLMKTDMHINPSPYSVGICNIIHSGEEKKLRLVRQRTCLAWHKGRVKKKKKLLSSTSLQQPHWLCLHDSPSLLCQFHWSTTFSNLLFISTPFTLLSWIYFPIWASFILTVGPLFLHWSLTFLTLSGLHRMLVNYLTPTAPNLDQLLTRSALAKQVGKITLFGTVTLKIISPSGQNHTVLPTILPASACLICLFKCIGCWTPVDLGQCTKLGERNHINL